LHALTPTTIATTNASANVTNFGRLERIDMQPN